MRTYCRYCQERLRLRDGIYQRASPYVDTDPAECRATGGEHVPR